MRILIFGVSGMLGNQLFKYFSMSSQYETYGTIRQPILPEFGFQDDFINNVVQGIDALNFESLQEVVATVKPNIVINCIGVVKQLEISNDPLVSIPINSILPHMLTKICQTNAARLIHFSTDCVFTGRKGNYTEKDIPDAEDLYGRSKILGELEYPNTVTLRTSIIGREPKGARSLVNWFLSQDESVKGFKNAIFSGLPTCEIAKVIKMHIIPNDMLSGIFHLASNPIDKYQLLCKIAEKFNKNITIIPDDKFKINRSLNASKLLAETGYAPPDWDILIGEMHLHWK